MSRPEPLIRILIADDHPITREGLALLLETQPCLTVVAQACDGHQAVELYLQNRPDVCVLDLQMPRLSGAQATAAILQQDPQARILLLTTFGGDEDIFRALQAGAMAYLLKDAPTSEVVSAIRSVARGTRYLPPEVGAQLANRLGREELTRREREVLKLLALGKANKEIAAELKIREGTVKSHVSALTQKLQASSRTDAVLLALRTGLLRP